MFALDLSYHRDVDPWPIVSCAKEKICNRHSNEYGQAPLSIGICKWILVMRLDSIS